MLNQTILLRVKKLIFQIMNYNLKTKKENTKLKRSRTLGIIIDKSREAIPIQGEPRAY